MFTKFNEYELLEIFENEPALVAEKETGIFVYSKENGHGFQLLLTLSIYEKKCNLSLAYCDFIKPIFDVELENVESIQCLDGKLRIISKDNDDIVIFFKPNFSIKFGDLV